MPIGMNIIHHATWMLWSCFRVVSGFCPGWLVVLMVLEGLVFIQPRPVNAKTVILDGDLRHVTVTQGMEFLVETESLSQIEAASPALASRWQPFDGKNFVFKKIHSPVWLRFDIVNASAQNLSWLLESSWQFIDHIELAQYFPSLGVWSPMQFGGALKPASIRPIRHRHFLFPLKLPPGERTTIYLRLASTQSLQLAFDLWQNSEFWIRDHQRTYLFGLFFGILIVMLLYSLFLCVFTRDHFYLIYAAYVVTVALYELNTTGIGSLYFWGDALWLKKRSYLLFSSVSFLAATFFIRYFLSLKYYGGWLLRLNNVFLGCWVIVTFCSLFPPLPQMFDLANTIGILSLVAGMVTSIYLWIKGNIQAKYYTIAYTALYIGTAMLIFGMTGILERSPLTEYSQMIGFVAEFVLLSIALADQINRERLANEKAQLEALDLSRKISKVNEEKLQAQEQILEVQRLANEELEQKVMERTDALRRAMKNLEFANRELSKLSFIDPLTKIYNRRYFDHVLANEIKRASRNGQPVAVALVDIDYFKKVNDSFGHLIGDECLRLVANALKQETGRANDLLARYGGEEFAFILPATTQEQAVIVADRARIAIENIRFIHHSQRINLRVSIGVAGWIPETGETPQQLIQAADNALYEAKSRGRNKTVSAAG